MARWTGQIYKRTGDHNRIITTVSADLDVGMDAFRAKQMMSSMYNISDEEWSGLPSCEQTIESVDEDGNVSVRRRRSYSGGRGSIGRSIKYYAIMGIGLFVVLMVGRLNNNNPQSPPQQTQTPYVSPPQQQTPAPAQAPTTRSEQPSAIMPGQPWLGVYAQNIDQANHGVVLTDVTANGPAAVAGLTVGMMVVKINGQQVFNYANFVQRISTFSPGTIVELLVIQNRQYRTIKVRLGTRH